MDDNAKYILNLIKRQIVLGNLNMQKLTIAVYRLHILIGKEITYEEAAEYAHKFYYGDRYEYDI